MFDKDFNVTAHVDAEDRKIARLYVYLKQAEIALSVAKEAYELEKNFDLAKATEHFKEILSKYETRIEKLVI